MNRIRAARLADEPRDYQALGLSQGTVEAWEDAFRTAEGGPGTYEWWYFDAHLNDGSILVIIFYTKGFNESRAKLRPKVSFRWDRPDGTRLKHSIATSAQEFYADVDNCDVCIGPAKMSAAVDEYRLTIHDGDFRAVITLARDTPSWRPATGHWLFDEDHQKKFAWLLAVPCGRVTASLDIGGKVEYLQGVGYHDHNWGTVAMSHLLDHWWWAHTTIGDRTVVVYDLITARKYGHIQLSTVLIMDGTNVIDDETIESTLSLYPQNSGASAIPDNFTISYHQGPARARVTFHRRRVILHRRLIDQLTGARRLLAKLIASQGAYWRFTGTAEMLSDDSSGSPIPVYAASAPCTWELVDFNGVCDPKPLDRSVGVIRPSKVMAKALRAGFHRIIRRARPRPVGSRDRVTR
ncbi:Hydroxyneurosporene synthase (CrtC) [Nocardia brasiliensis]|nr:Hydroxyneurosporene synthase (CrtC) [Nocardia brasiliensis]